ncbi:uncharacterized protein N7483_005498 [Penicillium malachiteum]|uniref:uncharacterized protein n=1 Tax=Penicillium malachiteum TaxID=1324776 RepID=UPI0025482327|nr:uncharacterized protein N7483_005498 [Penicillium malachiteum]KAJ5730990.1 hypothetical protein N7483_005498 [Penicillium malachiteum]
MCREAAAKILKDIDDVRTGLNYQKIIIIDQLESAEGFVNILNSDHDKIDAWLWGPIATSVAESTGVAMQDFAAAGSLFVGGLIVASSPGERGKNIMDAISNARSEHARLKTSLNLMVFALDTLKRLEDCSKKIHEFWNGMLTNAMILQYMDLATTKRLGEEILKPDNIESSNKATRDFERVNRSLLGILNRDGIRPPIDDDDDDECE